MNGVGLRHDTTAIRGTMTIIHIRYICWFAKQRYDKIPKFFHKIWKKCCWLLTKGGRASYICRTIHNGRRRPHHLSTPGKSSFPAGCGSLSTSFNKFSSFYQQKRTRQEPPCRNRGKTGPKYRPQQEGFRPLPAFRIRLSASGFRLPH